MNKHTLQEKFATLPSLKVCVIGDVMLDTYTYGKVERISAEAPVPIIHIVDTMHVLGGAGNVFANLSMVGMGVSLVSSVGTDESGQKVVELLKEKTQPGVTHYLTKNSKKPTTNKQRIIASNQQLLRIDTEDTHEISTDIVYEVTANLEAALEGVQVVCISDYGKGFITAPIMEAILTIAARKNIPVVVDTKPKNINFFYNCTLISPNESELQQMTTEGTIEERAQSLASQTRSNILVTLGGKGVYYADYKDSDNNFSLPSFAKDVRDVSGAGDTVVAFVVVGLALGLSMYESVTLANHAAAISVSKPHTAVVTTEELLAVI